MSVTDELLSNAEAYKATFDKGDLPLPPGRKIAILACMDARLNPYGLLGLQEGDAHVIRNAGGVVTDDEIRSLAISQRLLGTEEIVASRSLASTRARSSRRRTACADSSTTCTRVTCGRWCSAFSGPGTASGSG